MRLQIIQKQPQPTETITVRPKPLVVPSRAARVLDFDLENRPLSYLGSDFTTAEVTAIAWAWDESSIHVELLGERELPDILKSFVEAWRTADVVVGHYVRGHDIPMINGALMECGLPPLEDKRVHDTKIDLIRTKGISLSQESLGAMARIEASKVQMNQAKWREANRLTPEGRRLVRERVIGDVRQNIQLRRWLRDKGYLTAPKWWRSGSARVEAYVP